MQQGDAGLRAVLPIETSLIGEPPAVRVGWLQVTDFAVFGTPAKIVAVIVVRPPSNSIHNARMTSGSTE